MKWFSCFLIAFSLLVPNVYADDLKQQEYMIDKIEKLINEQPDNWYISNDSLFYCPDKKYMKGVSEKTYPEHSAYTEIVIDFRILRGSENSYYSFEKPDLGLLSNYDHGNQLEVFNRLDKIIKVLLYKRLEKEVGWYVKNIEEKQKEISNVEEKEVVEKQSDDGRKKL